MSDIIVSVPGKDWDAWLAEPRGGNWYWRGSAKIPPVAAGDRLYVAALGLVQGFATIKALELGEMKPPTTSWGRETRRWRISAHGWTGHSNCWPFVSLSTWVHADRFITAPQQTGGAS